MNQYLFGISVNNGLVQALKFQAIPSTDLPLSGVSAGTYTSVTVDDRGRVTSGTNPVAAAGTVTTVSVVTANGVSGSVANPTTTPAITITLGAITPTTVNGNILTVGTGTLTLSTFTLTVAATASISGTNTGDQTITLTGDVTGSGPGSFAATIAASAVTYAKMQNANPQTLLGNPTGVAGLVQEITLGVGLAFSGSTLIDVGSSIALTGDVSGSGISTFPVTVILRGYMNGLTLSNDLNLPNTVLDIAAGQATDVLGNYSMKLAAFTKNCNLAWAAGSGNGGNFLNTTLANSTWYHVFLIRKTSDGSVDVGIDTSVFATNLPIGYGAYRRIGSILTNGSAQILAFTQYGNEFWWNTSVSDVAAVNAGTAAVSRTLTVPTGVKVKALIDLTIYDSGGASCEAYVSSLDSVDQAPLFTSDIQSTASSTAAIEGYGAQQIWTNTTAQIRSRQTSSSATATIRIRTRGWVDLMNDLPAVVQGGLLAPFTIGPPQPGTPWFKKRMTR